MLDFPRANHHLAIPTMNQLLAIITMNYFRQCELMRTVTDSNQVPLYLRIIEPKQRDNMAMLHGVGRLRNKCFIYIYVKLTIKLSVL